MATRPWVTPSEVKAYTDIDAVKNRADTKLAIDIFRAEQRVIALTHNTFDQMDDDGHAIYPTIPTAVQTAVILLAEAYAKRVSDTSVAKALKSETFDDYAYTTETTVIDESDLGLDDLLRDYIEEDSGSVILRIRKL